MFHFPYETAPWEGISSYGLGIDVSDDEELECKDRRKLIGTHKRLLDSHEAEHCWHHRLIYYFWDQASGTI